MPTPISSQANNLNSVRRFRDQESSESGNTPTSALPLRMQGDDMIRYFTKVKRRYKQALKEQKSAAADLISMGAGK